KEIEKEEGERRVPAGAPRLHHRPPEITSETDLEQRPRTDRRAIGHPLPKAAASLDPKLRGAVKYPRSTAQPFQHSPRVVDRETDSESEHQRNVAKPARPIPPRFPLRVNEIEEDGGGRDDQENRVRDREEDAPALVTGDHDGIDDEREEKNENVRNVDREMEGRFQLDAKRRIRPPDRRKELPRDLDRTFDPAVLLRLERVHLDRELARASDVP